MANFKKSSVELLKKLPQVKGGLFNDVNIAKYSRFKTGGNAEILFIPADIDDLQNFLKNTPAIVPINIIGMGSNILIRDSGISGVTIIPLNINHINVNSDTETIECGCFAGSMAVSQTAKQHAISGLEFLYCIPGTIGGGVKMNAGCFGYDYSNIVVSLQSIDRLGNVKLYTNEDCKFEYRSSNISKDEIIINIILKGSMKETATPDTIYKTMISLMEKKKLSQPISEMCAGSSFKNPDGYSAWQLIKQSGADKLQKGGAKLSDKHANFIINSGNASSMEIEDLGEEIRRIVYEKTGTMLQWEIKILGDR